MMAAARARTRSLGGWRLPMGWLGDPRLEALIDRLHARSAAQSEELTSYFLTRAREGSLNKNEFDEPSHRFMSDKLVALDRDKAQFCYQLCRALRARRVVEAGTSFGVSTPSLAAAVPDKLRADGGTEIGLGPEHRAD